MVWKATTGFILSTELKIRDAIAARLVTRDEVMGASQRITRDPMEFAEPIWFGREEVEEELIDLLPSKSVELTADDLRIIRDFESGRVPELTWFKARGDDE
jgi:hypothetical protein